MAGITSVVTSSETKTRSLSQKKVRTESGLEVFVRLLPVIGLFWVFFFLRVYRIDTWIPDFIDEILHVERARIVWKFSDLQTSTAPSKFLLYYYLALFDLPAHTPAWISRTAVAIISMLGAAGTYALARDMFSRSAGLYALVISSFFPFLLFHERMALTDPLAAVFVVLVVWWAFLFVQRPTYQKAVILGIFINLMLAAKILAGTIIMMPFLAILLFKQPAFRLNQNWWRQGIAAWQQYRPYLIRAYMIVAVVWFIIMGFYVGRGLIDPDSTNPIVDDYLYAGVAGDLGDDDFKLTTFRVIELNLQQIGEVFEYLWGYSLIAILILTLPLLLWRHPWRTLYLLAGIAAVWGSVSLLAAKPNSRYFVLVAHLWVALLGGGLFVLQKMLQRYNRNLAVIPSLLVGVWVVIFAAPFFQQMVEDSTELELPYYEIRGYYRNLSGYAITDALLDTTELPAISEGSDVPVVYGHVRACRYMSYRVSAEKFDRVNLICHDENQHIANQYLNALLARYGALYVLQEDTEKHQINRKTLNGRMELLRFYPRPHDGVNVYLYVVYPEIRPGGYRPHADNLPDVME